MKNDRKIAQTALTTLLCSSILFLLSCSDPNTRSSGANKSDKLELSGTTWYDYGNGLINLSNITRITSQASISGVVMPKEYFRNQKDFYSYYNNLNQEQKAIVEAHTAFCFDNLRAEGMSQRYGYEWIAFEQNATLGAFETGDDGNKLSKTIADIKSFITPDFAENCVIKLKGNASLDFDGFSVNLKPYNKNIEFNPNAEGKFLKEEIDKSFDEKVGSLKDGKTPWNGTYTSLIRK